MAHVCTFSRSPESILDPSSSTSLSGLQFGNGLSSGDANALYFTVGPDHYQHGLFGSIRIARDITVAPSVKHDQAILNVHGIGDADQLSISSDLTFGTTTVIADGRTQVFDRIVAVSRPSPSYSEARPARP